MSSRKIVNGIHRLSRPYFQVRTSAFTSCFTDGVFSKDPEIFLAHELDRPEVSDQRSRSFDRKAETEVLAFRNSGESDVVWTYYG